jgi:hypothetical protein
MEYPLDMFDKELSTYETDRIVRACLPDFEYDKEVISDKMEFFKGEIRLKVSYNMSLETLLKLVSDFASNLGEQKGFHIAMANIYK